MVSLRQRVVGVGVISLIVASFALTTPAALAEQRHSHRSGHYRVLHYHYAHSPLGYYNWYGMHDEGPWDDYYDWPFDGYSHCSPADEVLTGYACPFRP
jgi:hypothetical protein